MGERAPGVWERKDKNTGTGNICQSIHPSLPVHHSCVLSDWRILLSPMCVRAGRRACASSVALQVCSVHQITNNWDDRNVLQRQRWLFLRNGTSISLQTGQSSVESPVLHCPIPVVAWRQHSLAVLPNWENICISFCYISIWNQNFTTNWPILGGVSRPSLSSPSSRLEKTSSRSSPELGEYPHFFLL